MIRRIFVTALLAGLVAGLVVAGAQQLRLVPLIAAAEVYESADAAAHATPAAATSAEAGAGHQHMAAAEPEWEPEEGLERIAYTVLADVLAGIGFAFILTGAVALAGLAGRETDARSGVLWGLAGFAVFTVAPSLGLPPELPGMAAADLAQRQLWWIGTALATAAGLGLIVFRRERALRGAGILLLLLPHLVGAPHPAEHGGSVPPELAAQFAIASIATAALFWVVLGGVGGWMWKRLA